MTLADGLTWHPSEYGTIAACIPEWLGHVVTTPIGVFRCRDVGGGIRTEYNEYYDEHVIRLDVMSDGEIGCNYCLVEWGKP